MMFCFNCGAEIGQDAAFCPSCGARVPGQPLHPAGASAEGQPPVNAGMPSEEPQVVNAGTPYAFQPAIGAGPFPQQQEAQETALPMKWFKFIIYFQLFASCVMAAYSGITMLTGSVWRASGLSSEFVYAMFPSLRIIFLITGIGEILIAVGTILCRQKLAHFKKGGPQLYWGLMGANIVLSVFLLVSFSSALGQAILSSDIIIQLVVSGAMLAVNIVYFKKRMHLFVN